MAAFTVPIGTPFLAVLCPVLTRSQEYEVRHPVVPLVVVLVVHVHTCRYRPDFPGVHPPVQQSATTVAVVGITLAGVPAHSVVLDVFSHVKTVSVVMTDEACFHP
jgi:hypothetical protein